MRVVERRCLEFEPFLIGTDFSSICLASQVSECTDLPRYDTTQRLTARQRPPVDTGMDKGLPT